jgi:hypothetical protein
MQISYRASRNAQVAILNPLPLTCSRKMVFGGDEKCGMSNLMTDQENQILQALLELEQAVKTIATANPKPNLLPLFSRLDELTNQLPAGADPTLLHYLHKKSYEKARLFLQGRDAENTMGSCGHL